MPTIRDLAWKDLYNQRRGQIDEQFAFTAFRTAPLVSASTMDAKVVTGDLASRFMVWAAIGKPNQREWAPGGSGYAKNDGLYPSGYYLFGGAGHRFSWPTGEPATARAVSPPPAKAADSERLWKGWLLPASPADAWFVAGSSTRYASSCATTPFSN